MDEFADAYDFVTALLQRVSPEARLTEMFVGPPDHYTIRVDLPGTIGKMLIVSRTVVDRAPVNAAALRSLELVLRSAVLRERSHRAIDEGHTGASLAPPPAEMQTLAQACDRCGRPISLRDPVVLRQGQLFHRRCYAPRST